MEVTQPQPAAPEATKPEKDFLEKTWDFFASVPVATVMIFVIAAASVAGSLIEQEGQYNDWRPPMDFYPARYGPFWGNLLYKTGMTHMYTTWWYLLLLAMLGASLVICSLERFIPLWRAVQHPNVAPPEIFVKRLKHNFSFPRAAAAGNPLAPLAERLKARRYFVVQQGDRLYADKGRWGRWGPYITHIGLILILAGAMSRAIPGLYLDDQIWVPDGQTVKVPSTNYYVENKKFTAEFYEDGRPKTYSTDAALIAGGKVVKEQTILMNHPLQYGFLELYQASYKQGLGNVSIEITDKAAGTKLGAFTIDLAQPAEQYTAGAYSFKLEQYFPDFGMDDAGKPVSKSSDPNNPGLLFNVTGPDGKSFKTWYFALYPELEFDQSVPIKFATTNMGVTSTTGLRVKKDYGIPVIYVGLLIVSIGVFLTFYLPHRRYWALVDGEKVVLGGWTNRNPSSLRHEMALLRAQLDPANPLAENPLEVEER